MHVHRLCGMIGTQRLSRPLTSLDAAHALLLDGLNAVAPADVALSDALRCVAADMPPAAAIPTHDNAAADGWAARAGDLVGASSYAPSSLTVAPVWVDAGDAMPRGCDCVVDADLVEPLGPLFQVLAEAPPGQGVRRAGGDLAALRRVAEAGQPIRPFDLLIARAAGRTTLKVRRPRVRLVNCPAANRRDITAPMIVELLEAAGAAVISISATARTAGAIADTLDVDACDLLLLVGGTGLGRNDCTVAALSHHGAAPAHGIAMQPGRTAAIGRIDAVPVVALPGAPDQALAAWWTLALPVLDQLSGRAPRRVITRPLARKIASGVGIAEIVLLERSGVAWSPLASGDFSLDQIARADAWCVVPGHSEGFAAGTMLDACSLRDDG